MRFATIAGAVVAATPAFAAQCNRDNCFRNLIDARYSSAAKTFCATYTTATVTAATAIPSIFNNCQGSASRVSSACSCIYPATASANSTTSSSTVTVSSTPTSTANSTSTSTSSSASPTSTLGLADYAKLDGIYFGTASDNGDGSWQDPTYLPKFDNISDFDQATPANDMKWFATEPEPGNFTYAGGDQFVARALANGQIIRCHNLVWYSQLPDWLTDPTITATYDNATVISILKRHVTNLITHWGADCAQWDVLNEALNEDGTYRQDLWYNVTGYQYIPIVFQTAAETLNSLGLEDKVKLFYNDYNIEYPGPKSTGAQNIVKLLQSQGVRIDGVGLQSHFIVGETPSMESQMQNMEAFTALGVDVAITELDIRFESTPPDAAGLAQQEADYTGTVAACANVPGCLGITLWDFSDKYSWIPSTFPGQGDACPWDSNNNKKPGVYQAIIDGLTK